MRFDELIEGALGAYVLDCVAYVAQTLTRIVNAESKVYHGHCLLTCNIVKHVANYLKSSQDVFRKYGCALKG
jgi:hypothetical protein